MIAYLQRLQTERDTLTTTATGITDAAAREDRDVTDTERATLDNLQQRCATIDDQLRTFNDQLASQRAYAQLRTDLAGADDEPEPPAPGQLQRRGGGEVIDTRSWGQRFIESAEFRAYRGRGSSEPVEVPFELRAPIDTSGIGGLPTQPFNPTIPMPQQTTPLLAAVGNIRTNVNVVEWLIDDQPAPAAGVVAEGALKPEANFTLDTATATLQTYAHWKGITRQALANTPMIRSIVESKLRQGINVKLEADIAVALAGATFDTVNYGGTAAADVTMLGAIREAIGEVQLNGFPNANSVLLNPADWAALDVSVYEGTDSAPARQAGFWGLRPIPASDVPAGTAYVGDVASAITVFDQGSAALYMTDSHDDFFVRNILVVLAEVMALPAVTQASALVKVAAGAVSGG